MDAVPESGAVSHKTGIFQGFITVIIPKISQFTFLHNEIDEIETLNTSLILVQFC